MVKNQPIYFTEIDTMKICAIVGCENPVFGTDKNTRIGYCKFHQRFRTDIKKTIRQKTHKERVEKLKRNKQNFDPFQWGFENELELFNHIWINSDKKSALSGRDLSYLENRDLWFSCFAHILNKKNFPLFRFNINNIILCHPHEHYLIDNGTVKERMDYLEYYHDCDFNIFYNKMAELKKAYFEL